MMVVQAPSGFYLIGDASIQSLTAADQVQIAAGLGQPSNLPIQVTDTFITDRIALAAKYEAVAGGAVTVQVDEATIAAGVTAGIKAL
jgi:hypothetical protein